MWTKLFQTGETISEPESWSQTKLETMCGVELTYKDCRLGIYGPGQYWQSDTYIAEIGFGNVYPKLIKRRISKYIDTIHTGYVVNILPQSFSINFDVKMDIALGGRWDFIDLINHWYVLEIDIDSKKIINYLSKDKI